jgi:branched-chain amino acid transport system ATP-binding protein
VPEAFLTADNITVRFGGLTAVNDVSIAVDRGEIVGVIGPNGAGKTTLFNAVAGTVAPQEGRVAIGGVDATRWPSHRRARAGLGRTFQRLEIFGSMTVEENLLYATEAGPVAASPWRLLSRSRYRDRALASEVLALLELDDVAGERAADLPTGRARVVELGRALCGRPSIVLLDEPSSGLDARETELLAEQVRRAVSMFGLGVMLIEHDMSMVHGVCERLYVLDFGVLIASGSAAEVTQLAVVRDAYLGTAHE